MNNPFIYSHTVAFNETDMAGIVHFSNYFKWMEMAEHAFLKSLSIPLLQKTENIIYGWPRVRASCKYHSPLRFEDTIGVEVHIQDLLSECVRYKFKFYKLKSNTKGPHIASGEMSTIFSAFNTQDNSLKKECMSEGIIHALAAYMGAFPNV